MYTLLKKVQEVTVSIRLSFCRSIIVLFCPGFYLSYQWTMFKKEFQCFTCNASFGQKLDVTNMPRHQKTVKNVFKGAFRNVLSHTLELHLQHTKPLPSRLEAIKAGVCCVHVHNFSISVCIVLAIGLMYKM
jgi:hypothetical protein